MVEVFKTNISDEQIAAMVLARLQSEFPRAKINFDLEDCDNILRVESDVVTSQPIKELLLLYGFYCEVLE